MPLKDLRVTLVVGPADGAGGGPDHAITFVVPANAQAGFTPSTPQLNKVGAVISKFVDAVENNQTGL